MNTTDQSRSSTIARTVLALLPTDFTGPLATAPGLAREVETTVEGVTPTDVFMALMNLRGRGLARCAPGTLGSNELVWSRC